MRCSRSTNTPPAAPAWSSAAAASGWRRLGIEPVKRVRAVREAIELVRGGCSGKPLTYQGELFKVYGYRPQFGRGGPPPLVYAGANQPQMLRATVPAADGVMYSDMTRQRICGTVGQTTEALAAKDRRPPTTGSATSGPGTSSRTRRWPGAKRAGNCCCGACWNPGTWSRS